MQVVVDNKTYRVDFKHGVTAHDTPPSARDFDRQQHLTNVRSADTRFTMCIISVATDATKFEIVTESIARCHPNDQFSREIGRKRSLAKALASLFPMPMQPIANITECDSATYGAVLYDLDMRRAKIKSQRKAFWDAHLGRFPEFSPKYPMRGDESFDAPLDQRRIYAAIVRERAYQDRKWGGAEHDYQHEFEYWIEVAQRHLDAAKHGAMQTEARAELLQVAATIVACLEACGVAEGHAESAEARRR